MKPREIESLRAGDRVEFTSIYGETHYGTVFTEPAIRWDDGADRTTMTTIRRHPHRYRLLPRATQDGEGQ